MLAMVQHPEVQKRAQAEIDAVVGTERLPDFGDRPSLPYIEAVYRETLRWHPAAPLGEFRKDWCFTSHHQQFRYRSCIVRSRHLQRLLYSTRYSPVDTVAVLC